jgi:hypothetical protein
MTRNPIFILLYATIALISCQKKETEKLSSNNLIAASNASPSSAYYRYYYKGSGKNNYSVYSGNSNNGVNWTSSLIDNGETTQGGPAATVFNSAIYEFHRGKTNNNLYYTYSLDRGDSWVPDAVLGNNASTAGDISACTLRGQMFVAYSSPTFALGNNSTPIYYSYSSDGQNWTEVTLPYTSYGDPFIFTFGGGIHILYCSTLSPAPAFTILSSGNGFNWSKGSQLGFGFFRYSATGSINPIPPDPIVATIIGMDPDGQLKTTTSYDLVNWTTPAQIKTASGQLAYTSRRPSISTSSSVAIYKAKTNSNIIYALPVAGGYREIANANGTTEESPYLIEVP